MKPVSLRGAAASGVLWTAASAVLATGLRLVVIAVIARCLTKSEFGVAGMLLAITAVFQAFGDFGLSAVLVQQTSFSRAHLSSVFWLAVIAGAFICGAIVLLEPAIVRFYDEPRLTGLVMIVALRFLVTPLGIPFSAVLQRDLAFRGMFFVSSAAALTTTLVTCIAAWNGLGVLAVIVGELAGVVINSSLSLIAGWSHWRPSLHFRLADLREPLRFAVFQLGERGLNLFTTNFDNILIGRAFGAETLAVYAIAFELASVPARLNIIVSRVAFPILARRSNDADGFRRGYVELLRAVGLLQLPLCVAIGALAPVYVPVFLGPTWGATIPLIQVLSLYGGVRALGNPSGPIFLAKGRPAIGFFFNLFFGVIATGAFLQTASMGPLAVAWTWALLGTMATAVLFVLLARITQTPITRLTSALGRTFAVAIFACVVSLLATRAAEIAGGGMTGVLVALVAFLVPVVSLAWWLERSFLTAALRAFRERRQT